MLRFLFVFFSMAKGMRSSYCHLFSPPRVFTHEHRLREATGERGERNERCCFNDGAVISTLPSQSRRKKKKRKENDHGVLLSNTPFFPSNFCLKSGSFPFSVFSWQRVTGRGRRDLRNLAAKKQKECVDPHSSSIGRCLSLSAI